MSLFDWTVAIALNKLIPMLASSVTSVGGTQSIPEVAVSRFFSGGGFSDYVRLLHLSFFVFMVGLLTVNGVVC